MFTGIIAAIGKITALTAAGEQAEAGVRVTVHANGLALADVQPGDSIAINGACMTVLSKTADTFDVDVSRESLNRTAGLETIGEVNLEKALTLADRLGGHLVSGHIDGVGLVSSFAAVGESWELVIEAPPTLGKYLAYKGSVVVNGVSLTVNQVVDSARACTFSINLIPHTVSVTTLKHLRAGDRVNLEIDLIARYVERILSSARSAGSPL